MPLLSRPEEGDPIAEPTRRRDLIGLALLSGALRLVVVLLTATVKGDTASLVSMARDVEIGRWDRFVAYEQHPLLSILLAAVHGGPIDDWVLAGHLVCWALTTLTPLAMYLWVREIGDRRAALATGFLVAIHPKMLGFGGTILTEPAYFCFYAVGLWLGSAAALRRRWYLAILAGAATGLCYLTRPEGILVLAFQGLAILGTRPPERGWRQGVVGCLLVGIGFTLLTAPYIGYLSWHHGYPVLSNKKGKTWFAGLRFKEEEPRVAIPAAVVGDAAVVEARVDRLLARLASHPDVSDLRQGGEDPHAREAPDRCEQTIEQTYYPRAERNRIRHRDFLPWEFAKTFHVVLAGLFLLGVWRWRPGRDLDLEIPIGAFVLLFGLLLAWNNWSEYYVSSRHILSMALPLFAWAGVAFVRLGEWGAAGLARIPGGRPRLRAAAARLLAPGPSTWLVLLTAAILLPEGLDPSWSSVDRNAIGLHLREAGARQQVVMTTDGKVNFYAEADYLPMTRWGGYRQLLGELVRYDVPYVVLEDDHPEMPLTERCPERFKISHLEQAGWLVEVPPEPGTAWESRSKLHVFRVELPGAD